MSKKFQAMCGDVYSPEPEGTCMTTCKADNPEAFAACTEHFKATAKPQQAAKKPAGERRPKQTNSLGHTIGTKQDLLSILLREGVWTFEQIMEEIGVTKSSFTNFKYHRFNMLGHVVKKEPGTNFYYIEDKRIDLPEDEIAKKLALNEEVETKEYNKWLKELKENHSKTAKPRTVMNAVKKLAGRKSEAETSA